MNAARQIVDNLLDDLPNEMMENIISYIVFIKNNNKNQIFKDLEQASSSSTDFWNNPIDDEVWNNV